MDKKNPRIPMLVKVSWFFLAVAIAGVVPCVVMEILPHKYGLGGVIVALVCIILI